MKRKPINWPAESVDFIRAWCPFFLDRELAAFLSADLGEYIDRRTLNTWRLRHGLKTGRTGYFHTAENPHSFKWEKGKCGKGCEKGWFKKGSLPPKTAEVGTKVKDTDGYWKIKVAEPNKWEYVHRLVWEEAHGKLEKQTPVIFLNQNKDDLRLENLIAVTRKDLCMINRWVKFSCDAELNKTIVEVAKLKSALKKAVTHVSDETTAKRGSI